MSAISAIVTAYQRIEDTLFTLGKLLECQPPPSEVVVHVDGNETDCASAILAAFPSVRVIVSKGNLGPGGGRNRLLAEATNEIVASFDDDSYPLDQDYFYRINILMTQFPDVSILNATVYQRGDEIEADTHVTEWVSDFGGGGCIYRRSAFLCTKGYVPLPLAYGMEEVDLALRLHASGYRVMRTKWLRVYHDSDLARHGNPRITAASIQNQALLAWLRYPVTLWPLGLGQLLNRVRWLVIQRRFSGIIEGMLGIPGHCWRHRQHRKTLKGAAVLSYLHLRSNPVRLAPLNPNE